MKIFILAALVLAITVSGANSASPAQGVTLSLRRNLSGVHELVIRNESASPVWYTGYGVNAGSPYYWIEVFKGGVWTDHSLFWCGVGLGDSRLGSQKELRLEVFPGTTFPISEGEKFRVSIDFATEPYREGQKHNRVRIYSNEITFIPPPQKKTASRDAQVRLSGAEAIRFRLMAQRVTDTRSTWEVLL